MMDMPGDLVERLAALSHDQWSGWVRYMMPRLMTEDNIARWQRQMDTSYANLSEEEKESDRAEARRILRAVVAWLAELSRPPSESEEDQHG